MSSPEQLNMADASAATAVEEVVGVQQHDDRQDQHEQAHGQQHQLVSTDDVPMSEDCKSTEHNAGNTEIDDASSDQHVVQEDFDDDFQEGDEAPQDELPSGEEDTEDDEEDVATGGADDVMVVGADEENMEATPDADAGVEAVAADVDAGVVTEAAITSSADVEVAPVGDDDGVEEAAAVAVEAAGGVAAAPAEPETTDSCVDMTAAPTGSEIADGGADIGGESTVADNADAVEAEAGPADAITADAPVNAGDEVVEADAQANSDQHMEEDPTNAECAEDNEHDTPSNQDPQQQHDPEIEHQRDEYDPADPGYDENAYDPENALHHAQDEYDPADTGSSSYERHGSDEYDPANPTGLGHDEFESAHHGQEAYDPENPSYGREEYDPSDPSYTHDSGDTQGSPSKSATDGDTSQLNFANKRKSTDSKTASEHSQPERDLKRPRGDSHDSTKSADSKRQEDKKGLADAAWDRLKDFQTLGEFQINQVSRAAFASVGALPEFAQVSIIARFTRVPMKEVRDKNGQLMRIHHEYLKENPHVASLKPVSVYIADFASDPGLFEFGYAPPLPVYGMSSVPVPYQRDMPVDPRASRTSTITSPRAHAAPAPAPVPATTHGETSVKPQTTDEFGRVINKSVVASSSVSEASDRSAGARATDPRRAIHERAEGSQTQSSGRVEGGLLAAGKPIDPRRRHAGESEFVPRTLGGGPVSPRAQPGDPRRRGNLISNAPPASSHLHIEKNELYDRLPRSVRLVLDNMVREGRLQEAINDNVISRLSHLPEHVALRAVENFSNVDLTQIDNLQGFLVGIINRVNEKAIAAERTEPSRASSAASASPHAAASGPSSGFGHKGEAVLAYPTGAAAARQGGRQVAYNREQQQAEYHGPPPPAQQSEYDRQYDAQPPPPQQQQQLTMDSSMQRGGPPSFPENSIPAMPGTGAPAPPQQQQQPQPAHLANDLGSQHGIGSLPLSVQQHLQTMAATGVISSIDEFGDKCYEVLGQLSEGLANEVLTRFTNANLTTVRNRSGFLIGVVKRCRQEYGFN